MEGESGFVLASVNRDLFPRNISTADPQKESYKIPVSDNINLMNSSLKFHPAKGHLSAL